MEQGTEESICPLSAATEQDINPDVSWHDMVQTFTNVEPATEQQIADPQAQDHIGLDSPSVKGHYTLSIQINVGFEACLSGNTIHPISRVVDLALGQNISETICRLRIVSFSGLVFHTIYGAQAIFGDFYGAQAIYVVILMVTIGAMLVNLISILISYWYVSDPSSEGRSNWITRLLMANFILLGSRRAVYWALT